MGSDNITITIGITKDEIELRAKAQKYFDTYCKYKTLYYDDKNAEANGFNWIKNTFDTGDIPMNFAYFSKDVCLNIINDLEPRLKRLGFS